MAAATVPADASAPALFADAVTRHLAGELPAARAGYERVLALQPRHAEALNNLATIISAEGDDAHAESLLQQAVGLKPDYGEALNNLGILRAQRGDHAGALPAFECAVATDGSRAPWLNNLGNALVEHFRFADALVAYDRALALVPGDAEAWSNRGLALRGLRRPADAIASLRRALEIAPSHVNALSNLAIILKEQKQLDEAVATMTRAVEIDPANVHLWANFAAIHEARGDYDRMRELAGRARALDPDYPEAYNLLANGETERARYDDALALYHKALALDPQNRNANWNLALLWLMHGDFVRGWKQFEWRKRLQSVVFDHGHYAGREWDGGDLSGCDVLLHSEQGIGDAIQFVRYAPLLKARGARRVYLECPYAVVPLLSGVQGLDGVVARGAPLPAYDVHANLMSLPGLFGTTLDTVPCAVPYIPVAPRPARAMVRTGRDELAVGFVWAGNPIHARDFLRSAPLDRFLALMAVEGTRFFSLQKGEAAERAIDGERRPNLVNLAPHLADFRDTAAVIDALDLVITVDTSVAHLAGALGRETWLLLPHVPDFRWMLEREDSPWYPTMRLFRQPAPRDWDSTFAVVEQALRDRVAARRAGGVGQPVPSQAPFAGTDAAPDETPVSLAAATRTPDGRPRFELRLPLATLAAPERFAEYEGELVAGGHDLAVRTLLDDVLRRDDRYVDLQPGLGLTACSAATAPAAPHAIILVEGATPVAERLVQEVTRCAPAVQARAAASLSEALAQVGEGGVGARRTVLRVGAGSDAAAVADAIGRQPVDQRPTLVVWSAITPAADAESLTFLESLGYLHAALSLVDGEASLDAIEAPDRTTAVVTLTADMLAWMEGEAALAAERAAAAAAVARPGTTADGAAAAAPLQVAIAMTAPAARAGGGSPPAAAPAARSASAAAPARAVSPARCELGIDWELRADTGWGVYGTNLALELERSDLARPALFAADTTDLSPVARHRLDRALRDGVARARAMETSPAPFPFDGLMLRALGNNMAHGALWDRVTARRNVGVIFFEDVAFDAAALERARALDLIVAGSHWNEEVLRAAGLSNVTTVLQGIDPTVFHPAPRSGHLAGRFVVFSGGKLEYRKGQDLVVAAFRRFRERHPEALLLTAWHNNWPQLIADLGLAGHVRGVPRVDGGRLAVTEWLADNGIPAGAVLDVGRTPNAMMGQVVREADVALFPNRCEGGTNLVAMECMAAGVPTIVADNSGHRDLVATGGAIPLGRQRAPRRPTRFYTSAAGWGESDVDEMVEALEAVHAERADVAAIARRGAEAMRAMSWQAQVRTLLQALAPLM